MKFTELSEAQWHKIYELMNWSPPLVRGTQRTDLKKIWNSIFYILSHGCRWSDLPKGSSYAAKTTSFRWLKRWEHEGVLDRVLGGLLKEGIYQKKVDLSHLLIDGTFSPGSWRRSTG
jgi:transposase